MVGYFYCRMTFKFNPTREQQDPRLLKEVGDLSFARGELPAHYLYYLPGTFNPRRSRICRTSGLGL
jgi:hypothetical protein